MGDQFHVGGTRDYVETARSLALEAGDLYAIGDVSGARDALTLRVDAFLDHGDQEASDRARDAIGWVRERNTSWPVLCSIGTEQEPSSLSGHQIDHLNRAMTHKIAILEGTPGTGKTFATCVLVWSLVTAHGADAIALCAPTGKAAQRLTEVLHSLFPQLGDLGLRATTIHRLLRVQRNGHDGDGWGFYFNSGHRLDKKFLIVDESSMLDTYLCDSLVKAVPDDGHVLFVGDPNQLPPVGHGSPLRDLIACGRFGHGKLTEVRRSCGVIVEGCKNIREGKPPGELDLVGKKDGRAWRYLVLGSSRNVEHNWEHFETNSEAGMLAEIEELVQSYAEASGTGDAPILSFPPVLTACNQGSPIARRELNERLDRLAFGSPPPFTQHPFRAGSPIICTRNTYLDGQNRDMFVANGDMGRVVDVSEESLVAEFHDSGFTVRFDNIHLSDRVIDLAYALTGHKSQGSEWPVVLAVLDPSSRARMVCVREWIYTVASRAKKRLFTVGNWKTLKGWLPKSGLHFRQTLLKERIEKYAHDNESE